MNLLVISTVSCLLEYIFPSLIKYVSINDILYFLIIFIINYYSYYRLRLVYIQ